MLFGRKYLGLRRFLGFCAIWLVLLLGTVLFGLWPYYFVATQSLLDAVLLIVVIGGDVGAV